MARSHEWTETLVDWVSGRVNQTRFNNLWLGGGAGPEGGTTYRPIDGQLTQRHVCYDTTETASPCAPSGFSSLMDNLRRMRYWQEPATWFGVETTSGLKVTIKPGLWYPSTTEYCSFAGGDSPTFTLPGALDRVDTVYIDASGILHIQQGTPAAVPTITLPAIASGIPLWAVYLTPTALNIYHPSCSGYYAGQGYIERDLRPFLNLGGGTASGIPNATAEGQVIVSDALNEWTADTTPLWKGEHSFEAGIAFVGTTGNNSITIPDTAVNALHILDAVTGNEYLRFDTNNKHVLIDPTADGIKVGIGLTTVPHGGVGAAKIAITGIDVSENGPHIQITTDNDDYPLLQVLANKHDAVAIVFDAYYDYTSWKSSDLGSNCLLYKESDKLLIAYDSGVAQGGNITWNDGIELNLTTGAITVAGPSLTVPTAWNLIVPDNTADAFGLDDTGGLEYLRINSLNATPYFLIDPAGVGIKVGVGRSDPQSLLNISGTGYVKLRIDTDDDAGMAIYKSNVFKGGYVLDGGADIMSFYGPGGSAGAIDLLANEDIVFKNPNTSAEAVRILSNGNVGIGTATPSSYYADDLVVSVPDEGGITIACGATHTAWLAFADGTVGNSVYRSYFAYDHNTDKLYIGVAGSSAIVVDSTRNVGIGTTGPTARLHSSTTINDKAIYAQQARVTGNNYGVYSTALGAGNENIGGYFKATGATYNYSLICDGQVFIRNVTSIRYRGGMYTDSIGFYINAYDDTGGVHLAQMREGSFFKWLPSNNTALQVYIKTTGLLQFAAYGAGDLQTDASGNVSAVSDKRLKNIIRDTKGGLAEVLQMQGKVWHWTEASDLDTKCEYEGFIADDIEKIIPNAVGRDGQGMRTMSYHTLMPTFAQAIKEIDIRLKILERR